MSTHLTTSESVSEGHPDKLADQISDTVLDAFLTEDPYARVASETLVADGLVVLAGEFGSEEEGLVEGLRERAPELVRELLRDAKSQVTVRYRDGRPEAIDTVVLSTQHAPEVGPAELDATVRERIVEPVSLLVDFHGTGREPEDAVVAELRAGCELTPRAIIERFRLRRPIYAPTSVYGHFGREGEGFPWEEVGA